MITHSNGNLLTSRDDIWTFLQVFKSHCAPEPVENLAPAQLTIAELKAKLKGLGQPVSGRKVSCAFPRQLPGTTAFVFPT